MNDDCLAFFFEKFQCGKKLKADKKRIFKVQNIGMVSHIFYRKLSLGGVEIIDLTLDEGVMNKNNLTKRFSQ